MTLRERAGSTVVKLVLFVAVGTCALGTIGLGVPGTEEAVPTPAANRYIGAAKCKNCHSSEESGNQYHAWGEAKHSKAYETLGTDAAKALAAAAGIDDPQKADACIKCHSTAHGKPKEEIKRGFKSDLGVQCESCHGPGESHMKARFAAAASGDLPEGRQVVPEGEIISNPPIKTCLGCHNDESPSFERFCYYEFVEKIRHLDPRKERDPKSLLVCGCDDPCPCVDGCPEDGCGVPPEDD